MEMCVCVCVCPPLPSPVRNTSTHQKRCIINWEGGGKPQCEPAEEELSLKHVQNGEQHVSGVDERTKKNYQVRTIIKWITWGWGGRVCPYFKPSCRVSEVGCAGSKAGRII